MHDLADYHTAVDRGLVLLVRTMLHITIDKWIGMVGLGKSILTQAAQASEGVRDAVLGLHDSCLANFTLSSRAVRHLYQFRSAGPYHYPSSATLLLRVECARHAGFAARLATHIDIRPHMVFPHDIVRPKWHLHLHQYGCFMRCASHALRPAVVASSCSCHVHYVCLVWL